jgi:putative ABC transport system permease protein
MKIPLIKGRYFTEQDNPNSLNVMIISESLVRKFFPNEDPMGKRIRRGTSSENPWFTIIGIVGDVKHNSLTEEPRPHIYLSYLQRPTPFLTVVLRTAIAPEGLSAAVRNEIWAVDKDQPVPEIKSMEKYLSAAVSQKRFNMLLLGIFAGVALILASVGIYGVMSYTVSQRTHEIGIRMALGARQSDVLRLIVGQGMLLALIGVASGLAGAFTLTRLLSTLLFGVSATDPATFALISILLCGVAFLASYIPARRAIKIDPMVALRHE